MKRCVFGAAVLVVLLTVSLLASLAMARWHEPIAQDLSRAAEDALAGNWDSANVLSRAAQESWDRIQPFSACFADHGPMEEIGEVFSQLEVYSRSREAVAFAAACRALAQKLQAMSDAHSLQWRNFF